MSKSCKRWDTPSSKINWYLNSYSSSVGVMIQLGFLLITRPQSRSCSEFTRQWPSLWKEDTWASNDLSCCFVPTRECRRKMCLTMRSRELCGWRSICWMCVCVCVTWVCWNLSRKTYVSLIPTPLNFRIEKDRTRISSTGIFPPYLLFETALTKQKYTHKPPKIIHSCFSVS